MLNKNTLRRMLIFTSGIAFLAIPFLVWLVFLVKRDATGIAADNEISVTDTWFFIYIQIFIFSALIRTSRGLLIGAGIVSIVFGLLYLYMGFVFIVTEVHKIGMLFFVSAGIDILVGLLALSLRYLVHQNKPARLI